MCKVSRSAIIKDILKTSVQSTKSLFIPKSVNFTVEVPAVFIIELINIVLFPITQCSLLCLVNETGTLIVMSSVRSE